MSQTFSDYITLKPYEYYEILGLCKEATTTDIKNAFKTLAKTMHPDKVPASERVKAHEKFTKINKAYKILSDPERRTLYDTVNALYSTPSNNPNANPNTYTKPNDTPKASTSTYNPRSTPYSYTSTTNRTESSGSNPFNTTNNNNKNNSNPSPQSTTQPTPPQTNNNNSNDSNPSPTQTSSLNNSNPGYFKSNTLFYFLTKSAQYLVSSVSSRYRNLVLNDVYEGLFQVFKNLSIHPVFCFWDFFVVETISNIHASFFDLTLPTILMTAVYPFFLDFTLRSSTLENKIFLFDIYKKTGFFGLWTGFRGLIFQILAFRFASTLLDKLTEKLDNRFEFPQTYRVNFFPVRLIYQMSYTQQAYFFSTRFIRTLLITIISSTTRTLFFMKQLSLLSVKPSLFRPLVTANKNWNHPFKGFGFDFIFTCFTGRMLF